MRAQRPLHILMTADAVGGVWQYALTLAGALGAGGHRVTLALLGPEPSEPQRAEAARSGLALVETGLPLDWLSSGPEPVRDAAQALADMARGLGADLLHCNSPLLAGAAEFPVPVVAVAHGCVATWWRAVRGEPLADAFAWHAAMSAAGLRAADAIVAPSRSYARLVQQTYGLDAEPQVVANGMTAPGRAMPDEPLHAGLTVGRLWDAAKRADVLDRAAATAGAPILAAGALRGPHGETFVPGHLRALGHQSEADLAHLYAQQPVFLSAASFEPFGLAVLEAAGAGCALVLSDIDTFRELWDGAALFVPPGDSDGFADALTALLHDREQRAALGAAARTRSARFTPDATAAGMLAVYRQVLVPEEIPA